jgi:hypothetical protein
MHTLPAARTSGLLVTLAALALGGCGGGGDSGPGQTTLTFAPSTALTVYSTGSTNGASGLHVGQQNNVSSKGGIRFPLFPFVDANDVIVSARLRVKQTAPVGAPYAVHGAVVVDHVDFGFALQGDDTGATVLGAVPGTLSSDATLGIKEIDVTAAVAAAAAANDFTVDFFLRFDAVALSAGTDYAVFDDHLAGSGNAPELVVVYQ